MPQPADAAVAGRRLDTLTWPEVAAVAPPSQLAVPVGSTEQHGPHLPLSCDSNVAATLAERLASLRDDVVVAPLLPYGSAGEHAGFPGTLSIGAAALELVVVELVRSAALFAGVVLISGHGGNFEPLAGGGGPPAGRRPAHDALGTADPRR